MILLFYTYMFFQSTQGGCRNAQNTLLRLQSGYKKMFRIKIVTKSTYRDCLEYLYVAIIQMIM